MISFVSKQVDRQDYILKCCSGKKVLNIGCLAADKKANLHCLIEQVALEVYGLDIVELDLPYYIKGDAQDFFLNDTFDVIVVGEVIEHLWNLQGLFESSYRALKPNGKLIITTPNAYAPIFLKNALLGQLVPNDSYHVLLFDITTMVNLLKNYVQGYFRGDVFYYEEQDAYSFTYRIQKLMAKICQGFSRGIFAELQKYS